MNLHAGYNYILLVGFGFCFIYFLVFQPKIPTPSGASILMLVTGLGTAIITNFIRINKLEEKIKKEVE